MYKRISLIVLTVLCGLGGFSHGIPVETAKQVGINFFYERVNQFQQVEYNAIKVRDFFPVMFEGQTVYYIFNMEPAGYIAVAANDAVTPVLAYSFDGPCSLDHAPEQFTAWMKQYEGQISEAIKTGLESSPEIRKVWDQYSTSGHVSRVTRHGSTGTRSAVAPLIVSDWNQNAPYNEQCPADAAGPGGHTYAGCVPVCMGQLMYYYRWPKTGTGSYSYTDPTYGLLSADFGATTYEWDNMTNSISSSNPGIAKLLFHLGISCDLVYGPGGSGMYNHKAAYALRTFFKYSPQTQYIFRDSTNLSWDSILVAHLDRKMPLYYAGWSVPNIVGHAFVCDGYQDTAYFHFNFGWSGQNNGYFYTNNLTPGGNNFKLAQEVIVNAFPDTLNYTYPSYCEGSTHLTYPAGSLTDGSGPIKNYQPASLCSWLIDPQPPGDSISSITLNFSRFQTVPGDKVTVYDGESATSPVLGAFSGDTIPLAITGTKSKMFLTFACNNGSIAPGWLATYKSKTPVWCTGTTSVTADTAVVTDGSVGFNYHNGALCRWKLSTKNGGPLTIHFRRFDTEQGKDYLRIYDMSNSDTLAEISGYHDLAHLPDSVTAPGGKMMLIFTTNSSVTATGWEIYYPKSHVGMTEKETIREVRIFPNPASRMVNVQFSLAGVSRVKFSLSDLSGRLVLDEATDGQPGKNNKALNISSLNAGLFFLRITTDHETIIRKVIIE